VRRLATSRAISASAEDAVGRCGSSATDSETGLIFQLYTTALKLLRMGRTLSGGRRQGQCFQEEPDYRQADLNDCGRMSVKCHQCQLHRLEGGSAGFFHVACALPRLLARHPEIQLEVRLENRAINLVVEGVDCAISYGPPSDADLVARKVGTTHLLTCAAPAYLARHPAPRTPEALASHNAIAFLALATARPATWEFERAGVRRIHRPIGNLAFNSMEACVEAAQAGLGITQVLSSLAHRAIASKSLLPVLLDWATEGPSLYMVYPSNRQQSARIRAFIEFVTVIFREADAGWTDISGFKSRSKSKSKSSGQGGHERLAKQSPHAGE